MRRIIVSVAAIVALGFFIIFSRDPDPQPKALDNGLNAKQEMYTKRTLLNRDIELTDQLCRRQCALDFNHTLQQKPSVKAATAEAILTSLQEEHRHMEYLIWSSHDTPLEQGIHVGKTSEKLKSEVREYLMQAKQQVVTGRIYESPQIDKDGTSYFILGVPSKDNLSSIIGIIHQDILHKVRIHQRKNLRLVPYPSDKRWKIESVDPNTLGDVKVNDPEDNEGTSHYHKNEVVVKFKDTPNEAQLKQIQAEINCNSMQKLGYTYVFQSNDFAAKELINYFKKWNVEYTEPHYLYMTNESVSNQPATPNDVLFSKYQWNLPVIEALRGWQLGKGSSDVIVAVIDTGVDLNHPDLRQRLVAGFNVVNKNKPPQDDVGHGTHVAGIISALVNNSEGVAGISWFNPIMPVKALDDTGAGSTYSVAQGIIWAVDHGAKVINMSLGNYAQAEFLHDAIKYAFNKDVLLIAASGNDDTDAPGYPAAYPEVLAVAATDSSQKKAPFSNYGDYIDVAAPGVNIASTYPNNQYAALSGTSMASPHAAALAALIRSVNPQLKNTDVMEIMRQTAVDLGKQGKDQFYGFGQIDVMRALAQADQSKNSVALWQQWLLRELDQIKSKYVGS